MDVGIIGAPVDLGQGRRGVDMGASAIRYAGLEAHLVDCGHTVKDFGNVSVPVAESTSTGSPGLKYLGPIVEMAQRLADDVATIIGQGYFPLTLGGDHSVSLGSVAAVTRARTAGIIWVDAHGDCNVPATSPSGNIHGMVLAALVGEGDQRLVMLDGRAPKVAAQNVALVGVRELDPGERDLLRRIGTQIFTMHDIDRLGLAQVMSLVIDRLGGDVDGIHLSLDLDAVDPQQAPGVGTPVLGGLSYRETHLAMELLAETGRLVSMDVVEVNPVLDNHNETARQAMEFILSALGKRIL